MRRYAAVGALLGWSTLAFQLYLVILRAPAGAVLAECITFLSYFTILSNLLVALVYTAVAANKWPFFRSASVQAAAAVSITVVCAAYHLLLRETWDPQGMQFLADRLEHYVVPACYVIYWLWLVPRSGLRWKDAALWLAYPGGYLAYTLARGAAIGKYPYPFVDVHTLGYGRVCFNAATLALIFWGLGLLAVFLGRTLPGPKRA